MVTDNVTHSLGASPVHLRLICKKLTTGYPVEIFQAFTDGDQHHADSVRFINALSMLNGNHIKFTASVPFERFTELKGLVEKPKRWHKIDNQWSYFEANWKPKSWDTTFTRNSNAGASFSTKSSGKAPCCLEI
ncbi:MAG: hypothetical protein JW786_10785 [Desulfobacterales bacterium]|nr:hypothetical protein [Desulfobacterales bacterium]